MGFWCSTCYKQTHPMEETIVNRHCLAKRRILTSNVRDFVAILGVLTSSLKVYSPQPKALRFSWKDVLRHNPSSVLPTLWFLIFSCFIRVFNLCFLLFPGFLLVLSWFFRRQGMVQELIAFAANFSIRVVPEWRDVSFVFFSHGKNRETIGKSHSCG